MTDELERIWKEAVRTVTDELSVHFLRTEGNNNNKKIKIDGTLAEIRTAHFPNLFVACFLFRLV
jgi:hypothetical protein